MKKYTILAFILLIVIFATIIAFLAAPEKEVEKNINIPQDKILYFYSDTCGYCIKQKPILEELEKEGVVFEYMNVGENINYYKDYGIEGTPSFIFKEIDNKLVGLQTKEALKEYWGNNK
jgi:thiol-disulfide isomerase/thioredoxin